MSGRLTRRAGIKRDCQHPVAKHQHGTYLGYLSDRCGCEPCTAAWRLKSRAQHHAEQARTWGQADMRPGAFLPAGPTVLRLQALAVLGHGIPEITAEIGDRNRNDLATLRLGKTRLVRRVTHEHVAIVYQRLHQRPRIDQKGRWIAARARRHGWSAPLLLDDQLILADLEIAVQASTTGDQPVGLDEIAVERIMTGTLRLPSGQTATPELVEAVARLAVRGLTDRQIGDRVGRGRDAVLKLRERRGIPSGAAT